MNAQMDFVADRHRADIAKPETEDTWERIAKGFAALKSCCMDGNYSSTAQVVQIVKSFHSAINSALLSERTRLSSAALELVDAVATACDEDFDQLISTFFPTLMTLTGRTNKVVINRTKLVILHIIEVTHSVLLLPYFLTHLREKSATMRLISAEAALAYLKCCNPPDIERDSRASEIESLIRTTAKDASADVRKVGREIFGAYKLLLPSRVDKFTAPLTPTIRKYLDIKAAAPTSQTSGKTLTKMKSVTSMAAASKEGGKKPVAGHSRTASASSNHSDRERAPSRSGARPTSSQASSRPARPLATDKTTVVASRPESSKQALTKSTGSVTGPSRVLCSSADAGKQPTRTRVLPTSSSSAAAAPQRPLSRPALTTSSSSSLNSSGGPRRVPLPTSSQSTGPETHKQPITQPISQQGRVRTTSTIARPPSQQSRPIQPSSSSTTATKTTSIAQPSRSMLPPKTRADGRPLGSAPTAPMKPGRVAASTSSAAASSAAAEPEKKPARTHGGLTQPTASQLAKMKGLTMQKYPAMKKPGFAPTKTAASAGVLGKSSKANVVLPTKQIIKKKLGPPPAPERAAKVPLPPSPEPADIPLPEPVVSDEIDRVKTPVEIEPAPIPEPARTPEPAVSEEEKGDEEEMEVDEVQEEHVEEEPVEEAVVVEKPVHIAPPFADASVVIPGLDDDLKDLDVYATPIHPEVRNLDWANAKTPISALLSSIQQGFEFSPPSPVSPPYTYLNGERDTAGLATRLFS